METFFANTLIASHIVFAHCINWALAVSFTLIFICEVKRNNGSQGGYTRQHIKADDQFQSNSLMLKVGSTNKTKNTAERENRNKKSEICCKWMWTQKMFHERCDEQSEATKKTLKKMQRKSWRKRLREYISKWRKREISRDPLGHGRKLTKMQH